MTARTARGTSRRAPRPDERRGRPDRRRRPCSRRCALRPVWARCRAALSCRAPAASPEGRTRAAPAERAVRSRSTSLSEETMTTKRSAAAATIFSRVCAAPPPFTSQPSGATWSAPSTASRGGRASRMRSTVRPSSRAACSVSSDVATQRMSSSRAASAGRKYATVRACAEADCHPVFDELGRSLGREALFVVVAHRGTVSR